MPITKGSRAAHERALKAAETRRRNRSNADLNAFIPPGSTGEFADEMRQYRAAPITRKLRAVKNPRTRKAPPFPKSYHATPTRHVPSYSAKAEQRHNPKAPKLRKPLTKAQVKRATNDQLRAEMDYWGRIPGSQIRTRVQDMAYSNAKDELRMRANPRLATVIHEISPRSKRERDRRYNERHEAHRARRGVKKQRGAR